MKVIVADPPLIEEIDAAFRVKGKPVLFAWGDRIYNPGNVSIPPQLMKHEGVHGARQLAYARALPSLPTDEAIKLWWRRYISDRSFRLDEEIVAHAAEYWYIAVTGNRIARRLALARISSRLAGPLYGRLISKDKAKRLISVIAKDYEMNRRAAQNLAKEETNASPMAG
ncbi:MAG: hypothetical protein ACRECF_07855 [Methyloceanibacter sp.]